MSSKSVLLASGVFIAATASAQTPAAPAAPATQPAAAAAAGHKTFYYWLHPKLGMVKVDRATNAMLTGSRSRPDRQG